jgi:hypothetical protein
MKPDHDDEARLRALFDRTAEELPGPVLTRLTARAADVPAQARRAGWWSSLRLLLPAAAVAAGVLAVFIVSGPDSKEPVARTAEAPALIAPQEVEEPKIPASEELTAAFDLGDEPGDLALDPIHGPSSDDEIDAWLQATAMLVDEGDL